MPPDPASQKATQDKTGGQPDGTDKATQESPASHEATQGKETTTPASHEASQATDTQDKASSLMDFLDIPKEVQAQITPKPKEEKPEADRVKEPEGSHAAEKLEATEDQPKKPAKEEKAEETDAEEEDETEAEDLKPAAETEKIDKRQKRIDRLTRQKHQLEVLRDALVRDNEQLRDYVGKVEGDKKRQQDAVPIGAGPLAHIGDEQTLKQQVALAQSLVEWCDANPNGATTSEGEFLDADAIAGLRRSKQRIILNAPERRQEIRDFAKERRDFNELAGKIWPEMFDQSKEEYQVASEILRLIPEIASHPRAAYFAGIAVEGLKALEAKRLAANGSRRPEAAATARRPGDIDPRAFAPRVPIAPHTANPPSREGRPSSQQQLIKATNELVADPDGGVESLAKVFAAREKLTPTTSGKPKPVTV